MRVPVDHTRRKTSFTATETGITSVRTSMDHARHDDDARVAAVAEMLERQRPVLTFDEIDRVSRRLTAARAPRRRSRRWSRLAVIACLSLGLLFATAGTGLAISGLATPGPSLNAQYPDSTSTQTLPPTTGGTQPRHHGVQHTNASPSTLGDIQSTRNGSTRYVSIVHAETGNELPFTGFAALPVLIAGIALLVAGALIHRRTSAR